MTKLVELRKLSNEFYKAYPHETAKRMIREKIRCMVPLKDIRDLPN